MRLTECGVALGLYCVMSVSAVQAATPATYVFYGRITAASGMNTPPVGTVVPITVTVDTSFPAFRGGAHNAEYYGGAGYNPPSPVLAASVNGSDAHGIFDDAYIERNDNGVSSIEILTFSLGEYSLDVKMTSTSTSVVEGLKIPRRIYPGNFMTATFSHTINQVTFYSGTIVE